MAILSEAWMPLYTCKIANNYQMLLHYKDAANIAVEASANHDEDNCMETEMADKLDIVMEILFKYIHEVTHINGT